MIKAANRPAHTITTLMLYVIFLSCLLPAAIFAYKRPHYNWDMLPYMAIVLHMGHSDAALVHKLTYASAKEHIPEKEYGYLLNSTYRAKMASNFSHFYSQLPFYIIKPLYIGLIYASYHAGFPLPASTVIPSILAYLLIGLVLLHWLSRYFRAPMAFTGGLLIMYSAYMVGIAGTSTPDCLSALFIFSAMYFIIEKPSVGLTYLFFLLAIFSRIDNIVFCLCVLTFLILTGKWEKKILFKQYLALALFTIACYLSITYLAYGFGWNIFYYPTLVRSYDLSHKIHASFPLKEYLALVYSKAITGVVFSRLTEFLFLVVVILGFSWPIRLKKLDFEQLFALLLVAIVAIRFILFPDLSDRFYIAYYLAILMLLVRRYAAVIRYNHVETDRT